MNSVDSPSFPANNSKLDTGFLSVPVLQEQVEISAVIEHSGTVRVRKVTRHDHESVPLTGYHERVEIERKRVDRPVEATQPSRQEADVMVIPVYEERLVKQLFLTEEIYVRRSRQALQADETVTLRREEVIVERFDSETQEWVLDTGPP